MGIFSILRRDKHKPIRVGDRTTKGLVLHLHPPLNSLPRVKFAVFDDKRFFGPRYMEFEQFLPEGFKIVGPPLDQNCYEYCLGVNEGVNHVKIDRWQFLTEMQKKGYECFTGVGTLKKGDIISYYDLDPDIRGYKHVAVVTKNGSEIVRSRWGRNCPVIEHPLKEVLPSYMGIMGHFNVWSIGRDLD